MEELKGSQIGKRQEKRCFHSEIQKNKYAEGKKKIMLFQMWDQLIWYRTQKNIKEITAGQNKGFKC